MTRIAILIFLEVSALIGLGGCQRGSASTEPSTHPPAFAPAPLDSIELEPAMLAQIKLEKAQTRNLPRVLTATGKVQLNEDQSARILAPLAGQALELNARVGDRVAKDQVLFSIKSREVAALVTDCLQGQRDEDLAQKTYNMTKDLFEHQAASKISLQQAEADLTKAKAQVARAEESLRVLGLDPQQVLATSGVRALVPVRSPISGVVMDRTLTQGQFVQGDSTPLLTVADLSTVWVLVDVFEQDIHLIHPGQRVEVTAAAYPDRRFTARVDRISDRVDPDTRTLKVRLLVSNPGLLLKPEMFISASVVVSETTPGVTVPSTALFTEGDRSYAFVAVGERRFARREVRAAAAGEGRMRVTSGLVSGDRVVSDGTLLLQLKQQQQQQN